MSEQLKQVIADYNTQAKHIRDHVLLAISYYDNRLTYLYSSVPSSSNKNEETYNIESSCVAKFLLTSHVFSKLSEEESLSLIVNNQATISTLKQKQLLQYLYENHGQIFEQYIEKHCYSVNHLKIVPFETLQEKDYIKVMNTFLKTFHMQSHLSHVDIQQQLLKIMNANTCNKEQFLNDYPILKSSQIKLSSFIKEQEIESYQIKMNLKQLFLVNYKKTFGYSKFIEIIEAFIHNFTNETKKTFNFQHVNFEYETITEENAHNMNVIFCSSKIDKKLLSEVLQLHLDSILKESKFDLAKEKAHFDFRLYEKAKIDMSINTPITPENKKNKRKI